MNERKPNNKKVKNKYLGKWTETDSEKINLPYDVESLKTVLKFGTIPETAQFSHQDIAHWCSRFWETKFINDSKCNENVNNIALDIANDVDAQWDMFLSNTYTLKQLQNLQFSKIQMPIEWFHHWLEDIEKHG